MKRISIHEDTKLFEPTSMPYMYHCHINDNLKLINCSMATLWKCDWYEKKEKPIKRWVGKISNGQNEFYLDFGQVLYHDFKEKNQKGLLSVKSTQRDQFLEGYIKDFACQENCLIEVEEPQMISKEWLNNFLRKVDYYIWKCV